MSSEWDATAHEAGIEQYDDEAQAMGWHGPEIVFGLAYDSVRPGQSLLDIGIGTGLGSRLFLKAGLRVHGLDFSTRMLEICRVKGFAALHKHDLTCTPYPFADASLDHAVCTGVLHFFADPGGIFLEAGRLLRAGGCFGFVVLSRSEEEAREIPLPGEAATGSPARCMYRHTAEEVAGWLAAAGFQPSRNLAFSVPVDRYRREVHAAMAYLARKELASME
jgi:SAM-dependent methyltransferase